MSRLPLLRLAGCLVTLGAWLVAPLPAQDSELGFAVVQLGTNGPQPFARALFESNPTLAQRVATELATLTKDAGALLDSDLVARTELTPRLTRLVIALNFQHYPVFVRLDHYRAQDRTHFIAARLTREWDELFPPTASPTGSVEPSGR